MPFDFMPQRISGVVLVRPCVFPDARGFFMESFRASDFRDAGICGPFVQDNQSGSTRGVLRGLHYQVAPHEQGKLVRVVRGTIWDVAVDIRRESATHAQWIGVELSEENRLMLYLPPGCAHGFVTLSECAVVAYKCTAEYHPESERGIRWDDSRLAIEWPVSDPFVSDRDAAFTPAAEQSR